LTSGGDRRQVSDAERTAPSSTSLVSAEPLLVVLRLLADEMASGRLMGQMEEVRTGERTTVHSAEELLALLGERARAAVDRAAVDRADGGLT
jgi:hypothetical protein